MRLRPTGKIIALTAALGALGAVTVPAPASAAVEEPPVIAQSFYWEDAQAEQVDTPTGKVIVETPNPFCPTLPGSLGSPAEETCAPDRIPVWVREGDYETPYMVSAVGFDLSLVPIGSDVKDFTVTLLEDERGCEDNDDNDKTTTCRDTGPIGPVNDVKLQACLVGQIFGGGEARPYKEVPDHRCSPSDPTAKRKEVKAVDKDDSDGVDHIWTFDLTDFAQQWVEEFTIATGVLISANPPKDFEPNNPDRSDNWRVVLAGPNVIKGIRTKLTFTPGEGVPTVFGDPPTGGGDIGSDTGGFSTTTTTTGGDSGFGSVGGTPTDDGATTTEPGTSEEPAQADDSGPAAAQRPTADVESLPGYVWLGIIGGLAAFALVRSAVLEKSAGIRPDGVLAHIRSINASRRGATVEEVEQPNRLQDALGAAFGGIATTLSSMTARIRSLGKRR